MEKMKSLWILTIILSAYVCDAYKILVVFPVPGKSHSILGNAVVKHLLNAGHEVTFITPVLDKKPHANLIEIDVSSNWGLIPMDLFSVKKALKSNMNGGNQWMVHFKFHMLATSTLEHPNVQKLMADHSQKFDLIIAEWMFNELYSGLAAVFDTPLAWFSSVEPHSMMLSLVDEQMNTAYNVEHSNNIPPFSFRERANELWLTIKATVFRETILHAMQYWQYNKFIVPHITSRGREAPSFQELKYNGSLVLGNSHVSLGQATRLPQLYKPIGGFHIFDEIQPLPEDIKNIMDNSTDGVIFFSLGSNLKSKDFPEELITNILEVFGSLKQTVFWKFEEELPNAPKNVHVMKWAPQQGILAHPNCVLFITHGGLLSITETIRVGVPIIGIPVFADQFINVNRAVKKGFAKRVDLTYNIGKDLREAIYDILTDPKYKEKVKQLSFIYHDRPVKPGVELVHWVEHVINTRGALHLRSPALHVPWYQKAYLDLAFLIAVFIYGLLKLINLILPVLSFKNFRLKQKKK